MNVFNCVILQITILFYWISKAVAVVGIIFANTVDGLHVLVIKRSNTMRDEPKKFGVPSGFLDWEETLHEAMIREVYEETSIYLP